MRGGRNSDERGASTSEGCRGHTRRETLSIRSMTIAVFGTPWKTQHQQAPLQPSGTSGSCWWTRGCGEGEPKNSGPSHRSQCGE